MKRRTLFNDDIDIFKIFETEIKKAENTLDQLEKIYKSKLKRLDKLSDKIAEVGGSWSFIFGFFIVLFSWVILNTIILIHPFDQYPFILLNLGLSMVAAIQAPVILMSQNRASRREQARAELDLEKDLRDLQIDQKQLEILVKLQQDVAELKKKMK